MGNGIFKCPEKCCRDKGTLSLKKRTFTYYTGRLVTLVIFDISGLIIIIYNTHRFNNCHPGT